MGFYGGLFMKMIFCLVCLLLAQVSRTEAATYSMGTIWFPALTNANLGNGGVGGITGFIQTDGTLGALSAQNIVRFQLGVTALVPPNTWSADVSAPFPGTGSVFVDGTAFFATATGLFFDFGSTTASYLKFERDSTALGQADIFFCLNAGGANCGGASTFDIASAVLFPSRPDWSSFVGRSKEDLLNISNPADILSNANVMLLASIAPVPGPIAGAGLPGFLVAVLAFVSWRRKRLASKDALTTTTPA